MCLFVHYLLGKVKYLSNSHHSLLWYLISALQLALFLPWELHVILSKFSLLSFKDNSAVVFSSFSGNYCKNNSSRFFFKFVFFKLYPQGYFEKVRLLFNFNVLMELANKRARAILYIYASISAWLCNQLE